MGAGFCDAKMPFNFDKRAKVEGFPEFVLECGVDRAPITAVLLGNADVGTMSDVSRSPQPVSASAMGTYARGPGVFK